jgi:arylsulfatase A-like enzyme
MKKRAIRTHGWKLIRALEPDPHGFPELELYDLVTDPMEQRDLSADMPDTARELAARMDDHVRRRTAETGLPDPLPVQPVPLKRVGKLQESDPRKAGEAAQPVTGDQKLRDGDFIGYDRDERDAVKGPA